MLPLPQVLILCSSGSQTVVPGALWYSRGISLLEIPILELHPRSTESESTLDQDAQSLQAQSDWRSCSREEALLASARLFSPVLPTPSIYNGTSLNTRLTSMKFLRKIRRETLSFIPSYSSF